MLIYASHNIVLQEIPNEVSLAFNVVGCTKHCEGCHSSFLWEENYKYYPYYFLSIEQLVYLIQKYDKSISCVLFLGGDEDNQINDLLSILRYINYYYPELKLALYTGNEFKDVETKLLKYLDYIKVGRYIKELGGLDSKTTNQKLYYLEKYISYKDITSEFQNRENI